MLKFYETDSIIINETLNLVPYTYQILNQLKDKYINDNLYLIIGDDNIEQFYEWKNVTDILKNKVLVLPRYNIDINKYIKENDRESFILVDGFKPLNISSTDIRNNKFNNDNLDDNVLEYIKTFKCY